MGEECGAPCPYCQSPPFQDPLGRCCREVYGQPHILDHKCQACGWEWPCRDGRARQRKEWCWEALGNLLIALFLGFVAFLIRPQALSPRQAILHMQQGFLYQNSCTSSNYEPSL